MAPNYPGQHSHFFLIIWANSSVPDCAGLRETTEKGLLISGSQVRALLGSPLFSMTPMSCLGRDDQASFVSYQAGRRINASHHS